MDGSGLQRVEQHPTAALRVSDKVSPARWLHFRARAERAQLAHGRVKPGYEETEA